MQAQSHRTHDPIKLNVMIDELIKENALLREQNKLLKHHRFGSSSENYSNDQLPLIGQDINEHQKLTQLEKPDIKVCTFKRKQAKRLSFNEDLPTRRIEIDLSETKKMCSGCKIPLIKIDEDITRKVEYIPARVEVLEYTRFKYACKGCDLTIKRPQLSKFIIPKSYATTSLLCHVMVSKYVDQLPLNRIEEQLKRDGVTLPRSTMSQWVLTVADHLEPIMNEIQKSVLGGKRIWTDDTILPLQNDDPDRGKAIQARLWVYIGRPLNDLPLVFYDYSRSRSAKGPIERLNDYRGYPAYKVLHEKYTVIYVACWARVRQKFYEASLVTSNKGRAVHVIQQIKRLYIIEKDCNLNWEKHCIIY